MRFDGLMSELVTGSILAILTFLGGVLFSEPIRNKIGEWRRIIQKRMRQTVPVRIFFICCPFCSDELKRLALRQNRLQSIFELDIANFEMWKDRITSENALKSLQTQSRLEFCEKFREEMEKHNREYSQMSHMRRNLAITELPFPKNFYTWNTRDRKGIVIGIKSLRHIFQDDPKMVNKIILRIVQRMLIYSLDINGLRTHEATRGCLFDNTTYLPDIQYSVDNNYICKECEGIIIEDKGIKFLDDINKWVTKCF